jgi:hypothetical protein
VTKKRTFILRADSIGDLNCWIAAIRAIIVR